MSQLSANIPSQDNAIKNSVQSILHQIHTAFPGKIVSFDPKKQTAQVQPMIDQIMRNGQVLMLPVLLDVPVQFPQGGGFALTFPLKVGDEGQVIINERCIDGWFTSGDHSKPLDHRMFDLSDASFIPGIRSLPRVIPDFSMDCIALRTLDNSAYIRIDRTDDDSKVDDKVNDKGSNIEAKGSNQIARRTQDNPAYIRIDKDGNIEVNGTNCITLRKLDNSAYIKIDKHDNIEVNGAKMTVKCPLVVEQPLTYQAGMMGSGGSGCSAMIEGDINVTGDVNASGVSLTGHTHPGDSGGTTGGPNK